jgi:hypothetical protein
MTIGKGPIEARSWTQEFEALAIDPGGTRVHGYDVEVDLAQHYRYSDVVLLALTGELPSDATSRAFEILLCFLLPISIVRAPAHATVLAGHCSGPPSGILATAGATLADDVMELVALDATTFEPSAEPLPEALCASSPEELASVDRLRELLDGLLPVPLLARRPRRELALIAGLRACGLTTPLCLSTVVAMARIPSVIAEAAPRGLSDFIEKYPMTIPTFVYEE